MRTKKICSWRAPIPRLEGMTLLEMLGFKGLTSLPYTDEDVGKTYVPPDTDDSSTLQYWNMIKLQRGLRVESLNAFLERFEVVDGQMSPRLTHFFYFMYVAFERFVS